MAHWLRQSRHGSEATASPPPLREVPLSALLAGPRWVAELSRPDGTTLRLAADASPVLLEYLLRPC